MYLPSPSLRLLLLGLLIFSTAQATPSVRIHTDLGEIGITFPMLNLGSLMQLFMGNNVDLIFAELPELREIRFKPGLVAVGKADAPVLDVAVRWLKENPNSLVRVEGHSDDLGTPAANLVVAEKRAMSVMKYLVAKGLEPGRISVVSYGSDRPVCMEKNDTCRARNRRASILVKRH